MTKLMDELVEIGAEAMANNYSGEDRRKYARHVLNAVLPVLARRMWEAAPSGSAKADVIDFFHPDVINWESTKPSAVAPAPSPPEC
jgi:hypothetical protein